MTTVVLYNASYEPLGHVSFHHAVRMLVREVAVVHEAAGEKMIGPYQWPKALRLVRYVAAKWLHRPAGWTKRGVLARDRHKCGYCGGHATPSTTSSRARVAATGAGSTPSRPARAATNARATSTPAEARMKLQADPWHPSRAQLVAGLGRH